MKHTESPTSHDLVQPTAAYADLSRFCDVMSDSARAQVIGTLMDGTSQPASAIARALNMSPQATRFHLRKLEEVSLIVARSCGRHRYYELSSPDTAAFLESVFSVIGPPCGQVRLSQTNPDFAYARTCYNHLAGIHAVTITATLVDNGNLRNLGDDFELTRRGQKLFTDLGISFSPNSSGIVLTKRCIDVTHRRAHIGGYLGASLLDWMKRRKWFATKPSERSLTVSPKARRELDQFLKTISTNR